MQRLRIGRLATFFTAAAFHNRRLSSLYEERARAEEHAAWADAWDQVATRVRNARVDAALPALANEFEREAARTRQLAWRIVCRHAAGEIRDLVRHTA